MWYEQISLSQKYVVPCDPTYDLLSLRDSMNIKLLFLTDCQFPLCNEVMALSEKCLSRKKVPQQITFPWNLHSGKNFGRVDRNDYESLNCSFSIKPSYWTKRHKRSHQFLPWSKHAPRFRLSLFIWSSSLALHLTNFLHSSHLAFYLAYMIMLGSSFVVEVQSNGLKVITEIFCKVTSYTKSQCRNMGIQWT